MVLGAYEDHVAGPRRKAQEERDEAVRQCDEAVRKLEEERAAAKAWNRRRLKAQADGEPFDEPYPITDAEPES